MPLWAFDCVTHGVVPGVGLDRVADGAGGIVDRVGHGLVNAAEIVQRVCRAGQEAITRVDRAVVGEAQVVVVVVIPLALGRAADVVQLDAAVGRLRGVLFRFDGEDEPVPPVVSQPSHRGVGLHGVGEVVDHLGAVPVAPGRAAVVLDLGDLDHVGPGIVRGRPVAAGRHVVGAHPSARHPAEIVKHRPRDRPAGGHRSVPASQQVVAGHGLRVVGVLRAVARAGDVEVDVRRCLLARHGIVSVAGPTQVVALAGRKARGHAARLRRAVGIERIAFQQHAAVIGERNLDRQERLVGRGVPVGELERAGRLVHDVVPREHRPVGAVLGGRERLAALGVVLAKRNLLDRRGQAAAAGRLVRHAPRVNRPR